MEQKAASTLIYAVTYLTAKKPLIVLITFELNKMFHHLAIKLRQS